MLYMITTHICCIYVLFDRNGTIDYVGRTKKQRIHFRMLEHKAVLGFLPAYQVVDECSEDCRNVEKRWIAHYRELGYKLRNINYGQGPHFLPESAKELLRKKFLGRTCTWGDKISLAQKGLKRNWSKEGFNKVQESWFKAGRKQTDQERQKVIQGLKDCWENKSEEEKRIHSQKTTENNLKMWANRDSKERRAIGQKIKDTRAKNSTKEQRSEQARKAALIGIQKRQNVNTTNRP